MVTPTLSKGVVAQLSTDGASDLVDPVLQVLTVKKIANANTSAQDRYRVILSDGAYYLQAMLSSQLKNLVEENQVDRNTVVKLLSFSASNVQDRRVLIVLGLEVVAQCDDRINAPVAWEKRHEQGSAAEGNVSVKSEGDRFMGSTGGRGNNMQRHQGTTSVAPDMPIYPIEALSPYQNKWTIKARVTSKSEIKHWSNQKGEGKLFSCNFLDESAEIKATAFNDQVDRWYNVLKEGSVYYLTKAKVQIARKQFSNLPNEYEISFERDTMVTECLDASDVPEIKFDFKSLDQLDGVEPKQTCDVIAIVQNVGDVSTIQTKAQKPFSKRDLTLVDQSGMTVKMTLWGKTAETYGTSSGFVGCGVDDNPVIAFKGVSVSDFGGRSLSMVSSATMTVNPDITDAHSLRGWYDTEGTNLAKEGNLKSYQSSGLGGIGGAGIGDNREFKTIAQAKDENLGIGSGDKPDFFNLRATIIHIRNENICYPACPTDGCNKKVTLADDGSNTWRCEKCDRSFPAPEYRYIISANVQDATGQCWLSGFNDVGRQVFGMSADDYMRKKEEGEDSELQLIVLKGANHTYNFNIRAKQETFNDSPRVRYTIVKMSAIDYVQAGQELAEQIKKYL